MYDFFTEFNSCAIGETTSAQAGALVILPPAPGLALMNFTATPGYPSISVACPQMAPAVCHQQ